jgi:uncharacterized RDD family membrane protein YckC
MSNATTLSYASPITGNCPLCHQRPVSKKKIYGHPVCKKCFYRFANRRQLDYLIDALVFFIPSGGISFAIGALVARNTWSVPADITINTAISLVLSSIFCLRDGFSGRSPGKRATDLVVLNEENYQPISFEQSFKRNSILLVAVIPFLGGLIGFVVILIIAVQVGSGYRLGDRFAKTKVIWRKYASSPVFGGDGLVCSGCGYSLLGNVSGVCPECGRSIPPDVQSRLAELSPQISA